MRKIMLLFTFLTIFFLTNVEGKITNEQTRCSENDLVFITESILPPAYHEDNYLLRFEIERGCPPYTYSYEGLLPANLVLDPDEGIISGYIEKNSQNIGNFPFILKVTDQNNKIYQQSYSIEIFEKLIFITQSLKSCMIGYPFFQQIFVEGGKRPYSNEILYGNLPEGIFLTESLALMGTCKKFGKKSFEIKVTDKNESSVNKTFNMEAVETLVIETEKLYDAIVGQVYYFRLQASGGSVDSYQWDLKSSIPRGMSLDNENGVLSGIPKDSGKVNIIFQVKNNDEHSATKTLLFRVADPLRIINLDLPPGIKGQEYSESIMINGGISPYTFHCSTNLPENLYIEPNTGIIKGTPIESVQSNVEVWVEDSFFPKSLIDIEHLTISINGSFEIITDEVLPDAMQNTALEKIDDYRINVAGGLAPYTYKIIDGALPYGVAIHSGQSAELYGTPEEYGNFTFTLQAIDNNNAVTQKKFYLHVIEEMKIVSYILPDGSIDVPYHEKLKIKGGVAPYTWFIVEGNLPNGLELNNDIGVITGIPTEETFNKIVKFMVMDSFSKLPNVKYQTYSFCIIGEGPKIISENLPEVKVGMSYQARIEAIGQSPLYWRLLNDLPEGLLIDFQSDETVLIEGKPEQAGVFSITLEVSDIYVNSDIKSLTIVVHDVITILTEDLSEADKEKNYTQVIEIKNIDDSVHCQLSSGNLPEGIQLDPQACIISGYPSINATSKSFCIKAEKTGDFGSSTERCFVLYVIEGEPIKIENSFLSNGNQFDDYHFLIKASGGIKPYKWYISTGHLPEGVSCESNINDYSCSGKPTQCGVFEIGVKVMDASRDTKIASKFFVFNVRCEDDERDTAPPSPPGIAHSIPELDESSNGMITVLLTPGQDQKSGINGYSYEWNTLETSIVDNTVETTETHIVSPLLSDGDHYFLHVASVDNAGNMSESIHIGPFKVVHAKGQVLVVCAGDPTSQSWKISKKLTEKAYHDFRVMGFTDDQIILHIQSQLFFADEDEIPDDVIDDNSLTAHEIVTAIKIAEHNVDEHNRFILFLMATNSENGMLKLSDSNEYILAQEINVGLDWLQSKTQCQIVVIVESCFSGTFIQELAGLNRTIITSTENTTYSFDSYGNISFSRYLLTKLLENKTLKDSFDFARTCMFQLGFPEPQINGKSDIRLATINHLTQKPEFINLNVIEGSEAFTYQSDLTLYTSEMNIQDVFVQVVPPVMTNNCEVHGFPLITLNPILTNTTYRCNIPNFLQNGTYKLVFSARNKLGYISDPKIYPLINQMPIKGDINDDQNITLQDAIIGLQMMCDKKLSFKLQKNASLNHQKLCIGLPEIMYVLHDLSEADKN